MNNEGLSVKVAFDITKEIVSVTIAGDTTINVTRTALYNISSDDVRTLIKLEIDPTVCMDGFTSDTGLKIRRYLKYSITTLRRLKLQE